MDSLLPLALALSSSVLWGTADYWAGLLSRRVDSMRIVLWSQAGSLLVLLVIALALRIDMPLRLAIYGAIAGAFGAFGLSCFYRGLAVGTMSLVAPASALGVLVPVGTSLVRGEVPGIGAAFGVVIALVGIAAMSLPSATATATEVRHARASVLWGLAAAGSFGIFMTGLDFALDATHAHGASSVLWLGVAARIGSVAVLVPLTLAITRTVATPPRRLLLPVVVVGLLDSSANMLYAAATVHGLLAVVAVLGNLYPAMTVLLARALLGERLTRRQDFGVALAVVGVVLVAAS